MIGYAYCLLATIAVLLGDYYIKVAADRSLTFASAQFLFGCFLYGGSALGWYFAMQHISLAQVGVAFSVFTLLALCAMGVLLFGETLQLRECAGIAAAVAAMFLMARFA